jgi:hypothetical protein
MWRPGRFELAFRSQLLSALTELKSMVIFLFVPREQRATPDQDKVTPTQIIA